VISLAVEITTTTFEALLRFKNMFGKHMLGIYNTKSVTTVFCSELDNRGNYNLVNFDQTQKVLFTRTLIVMAT